jgi:hypothetical protein
VNKSRSKAVFFDHQPFFLCCQSACERLREINPTDREFDAIKSGEANQLVLTAIMFGAFTLEGFINHYAENCIENGAWETPNELDALGIRSKWVVVPFVACGEELDTKSSSFKEFVELIRARNSLVHSKPTRVFDYGGDEGYERASTTFEHRVTDRLRLAKRADKIVVNLVTDLLTIDERDDVRGLAHELFIPVAE